MSARLRSSPHASPGGAARTRHQSPRVVEHGDFEADPDDESGAGAQRSPSWPSRTRCRVALPQISDHGSQLASRPSATQEGTARDLSAASSASTLGVKYLGMHRVIPQVSGT